MAKNDGLVSSRDMSVEKKATSVSSHATLVARNAAGITFLDGALPRKARGASCGSAYVESLVTVVERIVTGSFSNLTEVTRVQTPAERKGTPPKKDPTAARRNSTASTTNVAAFTRNVSASIPRWTAAFSKTTASIPNVERSVRISKGF
jgi:hypothetical protein